MQINIGNDNYEVEIIKKNNRNTYIRVKNGKIIVTTNYLTSKESIKKLISDNIDSIIKMIDTDIKKQDKKENFYYFGKQYDLIYGFSEIQFDGDKVYAPNKKELDKYLSKEIRRIFEDRLNYWYNIFEEKIPAPNLKIRKMTSRWGVCNTKSHYVIVHELSHFIYPNHQEGFWNLVGKYYPNYKKARKMLKE